VNEGQKTGLFGVIGAVMLAVGLVVSWPSREPEDMTFTPGEELFEKFTDPLAAASLKIVSFDEDQGQVDTFEVRRDRESGVWTIPSRKGYPADAVEQMKNAANALVGLKILDMQTANPEDHEALGVIEPKLETLEAGDVGVGRLVTFRDESQKDLAAIIIGNEVKGEAGRRYVRRPGEDPVFVVELDEANLSTKFQKWIEDDLLKLSSIEITSMRIEDYAASMSQRGFSLDRSYTAEVVADGSDWRLEKLLEYPSDDPLADPVPVEIDPTQIVNREKLNDIKNALEDLKIVDVVRKPEGMSSNLRADKDLVSDNEAVSSLASRGFYPVQTDANSEVEVLSANGELDVTLNDGVQYVLRFGNVSGLADDDATDAEESEESSGTAVNRYLLVTTRVDESQFPAPELQPVPQTIEELAAMLGESGKPEEPKQDAASEEPAAEMKPEGKSEDSESDESKPTEEPAKEEAKTEGAKPEEMKEESATEEPKADEAEMKLEEPAEEAKPTEETPADDAPKSDEPKAEGSEPKTDQPKTEEPADADTPAVEEVEVGGSGEASGEGQGKEDDEAAESDAPESDTTESETPESDEVESDEVAFADLSNEEKQERLEAEQEKILKANTRLLDARKDRLNAAKRRVSDLNARFADWYYVIPETTYRELRIDRAELITAAEPASPAGPSTGFGGPGAGSPLQIPGLNPPR
jgi:hypothetical protein